MHVYFLLFCFRRTHADVVEYLSNRNKEQPVSVPPEEIQKSGKPVKSLTEYEIKRLEVPGDLAYILEHRSINMGSYWEKILGYSFGENGIGQRRVSIVLKKLIFSPKLENLSPRCGV
ncbi:unnamed protein product [Trichobilharzia regenti]|nr:unnamed protein product [Trichobilharzia regenti]